VEFEFSSDPETAALERKVRRAAHAFQRSSRHRAEVDVEMLFRRYDTAGRGSVLRFEFVNVLMQLGLALLDVPGSSSGGRLGQPENPEDERRRRLAQLARVKGSSDPRAVHLRQRRSRRGASGGSGGEVGAVGDDEDIALLKWYREGHKKSMVKRMLEAGIKTQYHLFPRFGQTVFFEHELRNPFNQSERFLVQMDSREPSLRLVTDSEEWAWMRERVRPPDGLGSPASSMPSAVEPDMFFSDPVTGAQLQIQAQETVRIPFTMLVLDPPRGADASSSAGAPRTVVVKFVSASHGMVVALLELKVHPRPPIVHRTLRFFQGEGSIVKRCIRLLPAVATNLDTSALPAAGVAAFQGGDGGLMAVDPTRVLGRGPGFVGGASPKYIQCIETGGEKKVLLETRDLADGSQEIYLKYSRLGAFPCTGEFYILVFHDRFRARLHEIWQVKVSSRLRKDIHSTLGQASSVDLALRGDRHARRVQAFASNATEADFSPTSMFELAPNLYNQVSLRWTPHGVPGTRSFHVHLVDVDTRQLVCAWLVNGVASPPQVTKEFDVEVAVGEAAHKKISFDNPWQRAQTYRLRSSDPSIMRPKTQRISIEPHGRAYIRLYVLALPRRGTSYVYLMVNDDSDQNDECFRIAVHAS